MKEVKQTSRRGRPRGDRTKVSAKNQVTLPLAALDAAGLRPGDMVRVVANGPGELVLTREPDVVAAYAGRLTGVYGPGYLDRLRDEWA